MSEHDEQVAFFDHCKWKTNSDHGMGLSGQTAMRVRGVMRSDIISLKAYLQGAPTSQWYIFLGIYPGMFIEMKNRKRKGWKIKRLD